MGYIEVTVRLIFQGQSAPISFWQWTSSLNDFFDEVTQESLTMRSYSTTFQVNVCGLCSCKNSFVPLQTSNGVDTHIEAICKANRINYFDSSDLPFIF